MRRLSELECVPPRPFVRRLSWPAGLSMGMLVAAVAFGSCAQATPTDRPGSSASVAATATATATPEISAAPTPPSGTFVATGSMLPVDGSSGLATLLRDGQVLVIPGGTRPAQLYDPSTGSFREVLTKVSGALLDPDWSTLLADGRMLVMGTTVELGSVALAEVYDPATNQFAAAGSNPIARQMAAIALLSDGRVLIAGGDTVYDPTVLASAQLYDPARATFSPTGSLAIARTGAAATRLPDGRVLITGGVEDDNTPLASAEIYDPATGKFSRTGDMTVARAGHHQVLLANGQVPVIGSSPPRAEGLASAELYDPVTGRFTATGSMSEIRAGEAVVLLRSGQVLVAGGLGEESSSSIDLASAELYDPSTGKWLPTGPMTVTRVNAASALLVDGRVLMAGGIGPLNSAEIYYP
jgi:hypothetical protein